MPIVLLLYRSLGYYYITITPKMESKRRGYTLFCGIVAIIALCSISTVRGDEWSDDELDFTVEKSEARFLNFNNTGLPDAYVSHL